jgi:hypothetical protein
MVRSLPLELWPASDLNAWELACRPPARLRRGGGAGHMRPSTQRDLQRRYGYFLQILHETGRLDQSAPAGAQVTRETVELYVATARNAWGEITLAQSVWKLKRAAEILASRKNYSWLNDIITSLRSEAHPKPRREDFTTDELVTAAECLFQEAETGTHLRPKERARLARNALMMALLALRPLRHKNLAELTLETTFRYVDEGWWIFLGADDTKEHRADDRRVPDEIYPIIDRYLSYYRPILIGKGDTSGGVRDPARKSEHETATIWHVTGPIWVGVTGAPLTYSAVGCAISETTKTTLGVALCPHAFRRIAKTTIELVGGEHPGLLQALLHHAGPRTGESYNSSSSRRAGLELAAIVRRPGVTVAVQTLEGNGHIRATRGRITVLNRKKLEELADNAYGLAEAEYASAMAGA